MFIMEKKRLNVVSCSFGKDSLAMLYLMKEHNIPVDKILFCDIRFNDTLSGELPEHDKWIREYMIPKLERDFGNVLEIIHPTTTYVDKFYSKHIKGRNKDKIFGFPCLWGRWCNKYLKFDPITKWIKETSKTCDIVQYIGIAADETKRIPYQLEIGNKLPLVDYGMTEEKARAYCESLGILSPAYKHHKRLGCWMCHLQCKKDLSFLKDNYKDLYQKLLDLEKDSETYFKIGGIEKWLNKCRAKYKQEKEQLQKQFDYEDKYNKHNES